MIHPHWLAFLEPEGTTYSTEGEKYSSVLSATSATNSVSYSNDGTGMNAMIL